MNISPLSTPSISIDLSTAVSTSVLSMNLDTMEEAGAAMIKMMEQSVQPELGQNIDIKI